MGDVYRAVDTRLNRTVAIKVSKEQFSARFEREAQAVAALNHPNVCQLYDVGPNYLVMEFVEGKTLRGGLPLETALSYARQIADGLEAAHEKGIVHRDLKPANIKITPDGAVKILDFGVAKIADPAAASIGDSTTIDAGLTKAGIIVGTPAYISPEQARGKPADKRVDIWAFGVVLYEMITGEQLFGGETDSDKLAAVLRAEPNWDRVPARVEPLLRRCLEKDPKKRLRDIGDAMMVLESASREPVEPARGNRWLPWSVAALLALGLIAVSPLVFRDKESGPPRPVRFTIPLPDKVNFTATGAFSLSPDGSRLAFSAVGPDGRPGVWIHEMDTLQSRRLPGADTGPQVPPFFWSPDSRYVLFSSEQKLKKMDMAGGAAETVCDLPGPPVGGSWSPDGTIIFGNNRGGLWRVPATGGPATQLTALDPARKERSHELPMFLPDGRHFLYLRASNVPENSGIGIGSLDVKPERQNNKLIVATRYSAAYMPAAGSRPAQLLYMHEGRLVVQQFDDKRLELTGDAVPLADRVGTIYNTGYFSASASGVLIYRTGRGDLSQLTWFDRQGKAGETVGEPSPFTTLEMAPDGKRAAVVRTDASRPGSMDIWTLEFGRGTSTRLTFGPNRSQNPVWSPDGKQIVYSGDRDGLRLNLYEKPADGSREEKLLLASDENKAATSWSRDGRFLLFTAINPKTRADIWVLPMRGDGKPFPFLRTEFSESDAIFSPDGKYVAYTSNESGLLEIYVRSFSPDTKQGLEAKGGKWLVSRDGGRSPWWRADGRELLYIAPSQVVMSVDVAPGPVFQGGTPKPAFAVPQGVIEGEFTPDAKRMLLAVPGDANTSAQFSVVLNWPSLLKK